MKRKNATRHALFTSILSLLLCVSMLVSTTFAWFTDEVTSANNIIKSGNLDIELEYATFKADGTFDKWVDVKDASDILTNTLWEPGVTEVAYLRLANAGSLALKYQLGINIVDEVAGTRVNEVTGEDESFKLSEYINFGVIEDVNGETNAYANREKAVEAVEKVASDANESVKTLNAGYTNPGALYPEGTENEDSELYLALVVYMPTTVGNEANYKTGTAAPSIDLGINVFATQVEAESDSFGPDYDDDAWHNAMQIFTADDLNDALANGQNAVLMNDIELIDPDSNINVPEAMASTYSLRDPVAPATFIDLNGFALTGAGLNADGRVHLIVNNGNLVIMNGTVEATATNGGSAIYNKGKLVLNNVTVIGAPSDTATGTASYALNTEGAGSELTVNNSKISGRGAIGATKGTKVEVNGGTYHTPAVAWGHAVYADGEGTEVVINDGTFSEGYEMSSNNWGMYQIYSGNKAKVVVNGGTFESWDCANGYDLCTATEGTIVINGGTFAENPSSQNGKNYVAADFKAVQTESGWEVISSDYDYIQDGVLVSTDGNTYYISNRAGWAWMDAQTDSFFGNKTIKLTADIDFAGATITGTKFWNSRPVIDGQDHIVSNFVIGHSGSKTPSGLLSGTFDVKNLVVDNANVTGDYAGGISGNMYGNVENCTVKNSVITSTYWQGGGLVGQFNAGNVTNCTVENSTISGGAAVGGLIGILNETAGERKVENCTVENCTIAQQGGFGGNYDKMFGAVVGLINVENSTIYFTGCTVKNNTVKGAESNALYGCEEGNRIIVDGAIAVADAAALQNALSNADANTVIDATGITVEGSTSLNINGATVVGANFTNSTGTVVTSTINGTFKDCTFDGSNGLRWCYAGETVVFENCVISGDTYGIHFDGGASKVVFKNCTISGFNATAAAIEEIVFEGCTFVSNGRSAYNGINLWSNGKFVDCTFVFDGSTTYEWIDLCSADKTATFTSCVVDNGTTKVNVATVVGTSLTKREASGKIIVDGVECTY